MLRRWSSVGVVAVLAAGCATGSSGGSQIPAGVAAAQAGAMLDAAEHRIGPKDVLDVVVFEAEELSRTVRVSAGGEISLPLVGVVAVAGLTVREAEAAIEDRLRGDYMVDPHVSVQVAEVGSLPVYVLGEVNQPGAFPLAGNEGLTVLRAVALGEGLLPTAAKGDVVILRQGPNGERVEIPVDLGEVLEGKAEDPPLQANDIVFVPGSASRKVASGFLEALFRMVTLRGIF